jgi:hypothetical protein
VAGGDLGEGARLAAQQGAWICFEDEAGQILRPPRARTWGRRGHTPVVRVSGKGSGRSRSPGYWPTGPVSAGTCTTGWVVHRGRCGERRSLSEADYAALLTAAHQHLHAPIILIWDNLHTPRQQADAGVHRGARRLADRCPAARLRPRAHRHRARLVPPQAGLGNYAATSIDQLAATVKSGRWWLLTPADVPGPSAAFPRRPPEYLRYTPMSMISARLDPVIPEGRKTLEAPGLGELI